MSQVVLDDHLLRDVLADEQGRRLARLVATNAGGTSYGSDVTFTTR